MRRFVLCLALVLAGTLVLPALSQGDAPKFFTKLGDLRGTSAGQFELPRGMATDSRGHTFVTDDKYTGSIGTSDSRLNEYTAWGNFVKAIGWDVAPGAVDEEQELRVRATAGQFRLAYAASVTPDLPYDASFEEVQSALNALPTVSGGGGQVSVEGGPGGIAGTTPSVYVIRFEGSLGGSDVDQLTATDGTTPLSGGNPPTLEVITRADGSPGGSGLETCTAASGCKAGVIGSAAGQFFGLTGVAVDGDLNIYTFDRRSFRVQKFDSAGRFLWMIGGGVNKTTGADICTKDDLANMEVCGAGVEGTGPREFSFAKEPGSSGSLGDVIEVRPGGNVYVADRGRLQEFNPDGSFVSEFGFPAEAGNHDPGGLAIDPISEDIYLTMGQGFTVETKVDGVFRLSPDGELVDILEVESPEDVATDAAGNVYVAESPRNEAGYYQPERVVVFDSQGNVLLPFEQGFGAAGPGTFFSGLTTNLAGDVFVANAPTNDLEKPAYVDVYGPAPVALEPPPKEPPTIEDQYATSVDTDGAVLRASIDPKFWADTRYFVEYGTEDCTLAECDTVPAPPGSLLTDEVISGALNTAGVFLTGLTPGTTYHYRFVAQSSGGGPVFGPEATFTTAKAPTGHKGQCPANESLRGGPSAGLPDCRAYEMVSPVDKNGGDVSPICENLCYSASFDQSAEAGSALTYSSYKAFGDAQSAPYISQYLAKRTADGWQSDGITPGLGVPLLGATQDLDTPFKAFTPDLASAWYTQIREPALAPGSEAPNVYRRDNADGSYQALSPEAMEANPELQAITPDGRCAVFRVSDALTEEAKPELTQVYRSCDGQLQLVSYLPNGSPSAKASSAGASVTGTGTSREQNVFNAISDDGSRVFWSEASNGAGPLYLRLPDREETFTIAKNPALFWGAAADGSKAIYEEGGSLIEAAIDSEGAVIKTTIATQTLGVAGISEDASRVYFASKADLDAEGSAEAGQPNLYLREGSGESATTTFVVSLDKADVDASFKLNPVAPEPIRRTARTNPSGSHLVFMSQGQLTGFDNTDQNSGEPNAEVFLYDAEADKLVCASCNPTGARPVGRELLVGLKGSQPANVWAAARIPTHQSQLYGSRVLSDDGTRLYFESFEPLAPLDTNGKADVYQWEKLGAGSCSEDDGSFQEQSGGCVELISSGKSPSDSSFVDASADGKDVFIRTASSLVPQDPGSVDIYDAREGGGLPPPPAPPAACEGEACQGPISAPNDPTPASESYQGPGNVREGSTKPRCPKGKVRRKGRCVRKKGNGKHSNPQHLQHRPGCPGDQLYAGNAGRQEGADRKAQCKGKKEGDK